MREKSFEHIHVLWLCINENSEKIEKKKKLNYLTLKFEIPSYHYIHKRIEKSKKSLLNADGYIYIYIYLFK